MTRPPAAIVGVVLLNISCHWSPTREPPRSISSDTQFEAVAHSYLDDLYQRQPTRATFLGIHQYDDRLEDYSRDAVAREIESARDFRSQVAAIPSDALSSIHQLDREQLLHAIDSRVLTLETIRPWAKDPDSYSSGVTNTAYIMIKRRFAPPDVRLRHLVARERAMITALGEARKNIDNPPRAYSDIAIEQIDGNRRFFETAVRSAFPEVSDSALLAEFTRANDAVVAALADYKKWLQQDVLKRSTGEFAIGEDTYRKKLAADEMIETPLDELLAVGTADLRKNQQAFAATARLIDPSHTPMEVLSRIQAEHPAPAQLLSTTQAELDSLARFMTARQIITIPDAPPARVEETPPFLRATVTATMDTPGPFETVGTEAYYEMTLPAADASAADILDSMKQWYYPAITNVSVHEVWPGHYLQFLYARRLPSDIRKVFGAASNSEGWAHYCEQMVLDEGFHADDPRFRLAQLQDALLRDVRLIVGIRMHTKGMTLAEAEEFFITGGYQPRTVARAESKRATSDPTFGYYTLGKLMILKLRDDYKARMGPRYSLHDFHDTFISLGQLPLPLIRKAMLH
jgi:uncharacterized protein (DUF885 family)